MGQESDGLEEESLDSQLCSKVLIQCFQKQGSEMLLIIVKQLKPL
jgi:hypothetical protein